MAIFIVGNILVEKGFVVDNVSVIRLFVALLGCSSIFQLLGDIFYSHATEKVSDMFKLVIIPAVRFLCLMVKNKTDNSMI